MPGRYPFRRCCAKFTEKHLCQSLLFNKVASWKPETARRSHWRCSVEKFVFKNFTGKHLCCCLFLIKSQFWGPETLLRKTPTEVLSSEIWKIFKNNFFEEHLWSTASKLYLKRDTGVFMWILWIIQEHQFCIASTNGWFWNTSAGALFLIKLQAQQPEGL